MTEPSDYEKNTRKQLEKLEKNVINLETKFTTEVDKLESRIDIFLDKIFTKIEQAHDKNSVKLQTLKESIADELKGFSEKNEGFKNATAESIKEIVETYSNRLPLWATFAITGLFGLLTTAATIIFTLLP